MSQKILFSIIYIVKHFMVLLKLGFSRKPIICFLYGEGTYIDIYINIYKKLLEFDDSIRIVWLFTPLPGIHFDRRIEKDIFLPTTLTRLLKKCIIITASIARIRQSPSITYIGIMHGFASFGSVVDVKLIHLYDKIFLSTPYQYFQLTRGAYKNRYNKNDLVKVGYPRIDKLIQSFPDSYEIKNRAVFYGPTYHIDISSIFEYLFPLIRYTAKRNIKLYIKLHPFLYNKENYEHSGKIDWVTLINEVSMKHNHISLLEAHIPCNEVVELFKKTDYCITDCSGLGYEYSLVTGKPTVWLGNKLKIPLKDIKSKKTEVYSSFQEVKYRGIIGPIIPEVNDLDQDLDKFVREINQYSAQLKKFRNEFTFNLGNAAPLAAQTILDLVYKKIH
ncbi:MAG: CDP-glycerol glycerophosphotransferase family protein [Candidatus Neomarinimicrobiota bacterium]